MINYTNFSIPILDGGVNTMDCSAACQSCANAVMRSLGMSHWLVIAAFLMLIISRWASVGNMDNWADNLGLIILGVVSLFWLISIK